MTFDERLQYLRECLAEEGDGVSLSERSIATARQIIEHGKRGDLPASCDNRGVLCLAYGRAHMLAGEDGAVTWAKNGGRRAGKSTPAEVWGVLDAIPDA